jgi:signal transduction histidine kinase/CheY-like chemotaxis protein
MPSWCNEIGEPAEAFQISAPDTNLTENERTGSLIEMALILEGRTWGSVTLIDSDGTCSDPDSDREFLGAVVGTVNRTRVHLNLLEERRQVIERQDRLLSLAAAVNESSDLREVLLLVRNGVVNDCGFDRAGIFLYDEPNNMMRGTWGTDPDGNVMDIRHECMHVDLDYCEIWGVGWQKNEAGYVLIPDCREAYWVDEGSSMRGVRDHAVVHLRASGQSVGFIGVDNLISGRPIHHEDVQQLLPFAHQAATAIQKAKLLEERERIMKRQNRLMEISAAFNSSEDLSKILRLVRDTVVNECGFDRAGVFLFDKRCKVMRGTWGTDQDGNLQDIQEVVLALDEGNHRLWGMGRDCNGKGYVKIENCAAQNWTHKDHSMKQVREHAIVHLGSEGEVVGFIGVDNLLTDRSITEQDIEQLLPFAHQAAAAIHKAQLLEERERIVQQQRRLMEMSVAIGANQDLDKIFECVRDAVLETRIVDRVAFWLADGEIACGTYGTDPQGRPQDEHGKSFRMCEPGEPCRPSSARSDRIKIDTLPPKVWFDGVYRDKVPHAVIEVCAGDKLVGLLTVDNLLTMREITREDLDLLLPFSEQAALAIEKAALVKDQEDGMRRQRRLMQMAAAITRQQDLDSIFELAAKAVIETGWIDRVSIWLCDGDDLIGSLTMAAGGEIAYQHDRRRRFEECSIHAQTIFKTSIPYVIGVGSTVDEDVVDVIREFPHAVIALRSGGALQGIFSLDTIVSERSITPENVELVLPFADHVAIAIANAKLVHSKEQELERRRLAEEELHKRAEELVQARDEALDATRVKSQFLANMSHEIRTPLNGVLGMASLLQETELNPVQAQYLDTIQTSSTALLAIINDILDFSKIEAGKMLTEKIEFDLRKCVEDVAEMVAPAVSDKPVILNVSIPPDFPETVSGDPVRIRQILTNLTGNAIKFTERGEIVIGAEVLHGDENQAVVRIFVRDSGIGIDPERRSSIFESFTQADGSTTRRYGGTGLGLALSKQLTQVMDGEIGVSSVEGVGSNFWVDLPLGVKRSVHEPLRLTNKSVLVACESATTRQVLVDQLSHWGCNVTATESMHPWPPDHPVGQVDLMIVDESSWQVNVEPPVSVAPRLLLLPFCAPIPAGQSSIDVLRVPIRRNALAAACAKLTVERSELPKAPRVQPERANLSLRILVAEDNPVNTLLLKRYLAALGCEAICVTDGRQAVEEMKRGDYDLILMDVQMPYMDGFEATAKIRAMSRNLPIIALTAHAQQGDRKRCLDAGMDDYLSKPVDRELLGDRLLFWSTSLSPNQTRAA